MRAPTTLRNAQIEKARTHLEPLRAGMPLVSAEECEQLEAEWARWRGEWVRRRKIFSTSVPSPFIPFARFRGASRLTIKTDACSDRFWSLVTDALTPQEARELGEDLGIERDTGEHEGLEKGPLCSSGSVLGKRRR